jgi:hypothetical protein
MMQPAMQRQMQRQMIRQLPPDVRRMARQYQNMPQPSIPPYLIDPPNRSYNPVYNPNYGTYI